MTTKREQARGKAKTATVEAKSSELSAPEERALRMRFGLEVGPSQRLGSKAEGRPDVMAKLLEIERRAFVKSGRIDELRRQAGVEVAAPASAKKDKIVGKLKVKAAKKTAPVKAKATATAKAVRSSAKKPSR
ncbi:MAG: hypothetical protein U1E65_14055 [Myxococcota bacterium]